MSELRTMRSTELSETLASRLRGFLDEEFDDFDDDDWAHCLGGWHTLVTDGDEFLAHAAIVPRVLEVDGRALQVGYGEAVATLSGRRRQGHGALVMSVATDIVRERFEMGALATGTQAFYETLGWERWAGSTVARYGAELRRTTEFDDAVMVLRFGPSAEIDLTATLVCEGRQGDNW